ncbi:response regulator [Sedimentibacter sp.]|uniref:response regulator transcription factor n=1 Tax=Sedimentibacter sp. TaxID=1960295 RepID=UPI0028ACEC5F|nr:response regulator [Sedimentibacter sp.]
MVKILIVDDSVFSRKITATLIRKYIDDADIYYAVDGQDGFIKYKEIKPDCVLLDLLMPKVGGVELIGMIKKYDEHAKIIVLSADVQKNVHEEINALNVLYFINKPFNDEKAKLICGLIGAGHE